MKTSIAVMMTLASVAVADPDEDGPKSSDTALLLSAGGTTASVAAIALGTTRRGGAIEVAGALSLAITPSFGEWYAGSYFTPGMALRIGAPVGALLAFAVADSALGCQLKDGGDTCEPRSSSIETGLLVGGGMLAAGIIYDIATAPRAARRYNREHAPATVVPMVTPGGYGISLAGRF